MLAIRSARLFAGVGDQLCARPLGLVDEGRITDVDTTGADPPEGAEVVDLGEAILLPGLVDSHAHLVLDASSDPVGHLADTSDEALLADCRARGPGRAGRRDHHPPRPGRPPLCHPATAGGAGRPAAMKITIYDWSVRIPQGTVPLPFTEFCVGLVPRRLSFVGALGRSTLWVKALVRSSSSTATTM
jgi:hypothetical protein